MPLALAHDFPDPYVVRHDGVYYGYATESAGVHVQLAVSRDLKTWEYVGDALPTLPDWVQPGYNWAPDVVQGRDGYWLMYYSARHKASGQQAIGVAYARTPRGPFRPMDAPLIVGFIDADVVTDKDGAVILAAAGCDDQQGGIWAQRLTPDGQALMGEQVRILAADRAVEGGVVEAPTLIRRADDWLLLYSVNAYGTRDYAVHYAVAPSPFGPFYKPPFNFVLRSGDGRAGPGHQHAFQDAAGAWYLAFHAWREGCVGYGGGHAREFYVESFDPVTLRVGAA